MATSRTGEIACTGLLLAAMLATLIGCPNLIDNGGDQGTPRVLITQNSIDVPNGSQFAIGGCVVNSSKDLSFKIKNVGDADLTLTGSPRVAIGGADASVFTVTVQPVALIPSGGSASFTVRFTPLDLGSRMALLTVTCNDPVCTTFSVALTGEGTSSPEPEIHIWQGGTEIGSGGSRALGDSLVGVGKDSVFIVENRGSGDLTLDADPRVAISGTNEALFAVSVQPSSPIAAGESGSFTLRFTPDSTGSKTAQVSIPTNDTDLDYFTFTITATGTVSDIRVTQGGTAISSGGSVDVGSSLVATAKDLSFLVENQGTGPLILTADPAASVTGTDAAMFVVTGQPASPIAAGGSASLTIRFTPSSFGGKTAAVTIANNDPDSGGFGFTITGVGAVVPVPRTGQTVSYATRDDGALQKGTAWPGTRFTDNGNATMTDNLTGLMWEKSPAASMAFWAAALTSVSSLSIGGHADWRMPNARELRSVLNYGSTPVTWLSAQGFGNLQSSVYWTSTNVNTGSGVYKWAMFTSSGQLEAWESPAFIGMPAYTWAVRGESAALASTGQTTSYNAGDDGALQKGVAWPSPRFTDNADGTMTDSLTGLVWEKSPDTTARTWSAAVTYANGLSLGGRSDWRLPNINELQTLVIDEESVAGTWHATQGFSNVLTYNYWTSTTYAGNTSNAWTVWVTYGSEDLAVKTDTHYAWAVRGGN